MWQRLHDFGAAAYRRAVARAVAAYHGYPARALRLVGVTGTMGKTSTCVLLEAVLAAAGVRVGGIGSIGVRVGPPRTAAPPPPHTLTTPNAPQLQAALRELAAAGVGTAVLEVTTHGIHEERVAGLELACGVFTNLLPGEHLDYHPSVEHYMQTKLRFLDMLARDAPLVVGATNRRVLERAASRPVVSVALEGTPDASVALQSVRHHLRGTSFLLQVRRELTGAGGQRVSPVEIPIDLHLFGHHQVANATFAGTAALLLGAPPEALRRAFAEPPPLRRRLEVVWGGRPLVLDDLGMSPEGLRSTIESMRPLVGAGLRIVFGFRGSRGAAINRSLATTLGEIVIQTSREAPVLLVVTAPSNKGAGAGNWVTDEERAAGISELERTGVPFTYEPDLEAAVRRVLDGCGPDELVLLLGASMNQASGIARAILTERSQCERAQSRSG